MKKKLALVLALAMVFGMLAACGGGNDTPPAGASNPPASEPAQNESQAPESQAPAADGEVYKLTVHQHDPATSATGKFLDAWAAQVEEASGGRLDIEIYHGGTMGGPKDTVDMVLNGTVDIGWGLQSFFPGVFPASEGMMLPLLDITTSQQASEVMWHLYADYDYLKAEYEDYHVLLLHANCQSPIASKGKNIQSVDDLAGLNIRGNSGPPTNFIQDLGAAPVGVPIGELYNAIDNATIDAVITDWHAIYSFKLYELIKYYADENIGVSNYFMLMNKDSYAELPADLQQVLDDYSGEKALEICGSFWDDIEAEVRGIIANDYPDAQVYKFSDEERARLEEVAKTTTDNWIANTENGQEIYDAIQELIGKYPA